MCEIKIYGKNIVKWKKLPSGVRVAWSLKNKTEIGLC